MKETKDMNKNIVLNGVTFSPDMTKLIKYPEKRKSSFYYIPDDVKSIESYAFDNCKNLTTLVIPASLETIEMAAFHGCDNLKDFLLPKVCSRFLFKNGRLYSLPMGDRPESEKKDITTRIFYPDIDFCIPEDMNTMPDFKTYYPDGSIFGRGDKYSELEIYGNVRNVVIHKNVTDLSGGMFFGFKNLKQFTVDDENPFFKCVDGVLFSKDGTVLYKYAPGLEATTYKVPDGVRTIGVSAFADNQNLEEIILPDSVTELAEYAFSGCTNLDDVVLPQGLKTIGDNAFDGCWGIGEFVIPDSVTSIGKEAFNGSEIEGIILPSDIDSIREGTFQDSWLENIGIGPNVKYIDDYAFSCSKISEITIPDSVEAIGEGAFEGCENLTTVYIGAGVTSIRSSAFKDCDNLERIEVDQNNPKYTSVDGILFDKLTGSLEEYPRQAPMPSSFMKKVDGVFFWGTVLMEYPEDRPDTKYVIPEWVSDIFPYAFAGCEHLEEVVFPKDLDSIPISAFADCQSLKRIKLTGNIWKINFRAFRGCTSLEEIELQDSLEVIGEEAFKDCSSLKEIHLPSGLKHIEKRAFSRCTGLKELIVPNTVEDIGDKAFKNCRGLTSLTLSNGLKIIGNEAFARCYRLTKIVVPESICTIKELAFSYCKKLKSINIPLADDIEEGILRGCNKLEDVNIAEIKGEYFSTWYYSTLFDEDEIPF